MTNSEACVTLNLVSGIGPTKIQGLLDIFGNYSDILEQSKQELAKVYGISEKLANSIIEVNNSDALEKEMNLIERAGTQIITLIDDDYPEPLKEIFNPPLCLYIRGNVSVLKTQCIAIVGSRRISSYGSRMAQHLSEAASYAGWTVVSGLAYGTDIIAHKATLATKGKTIAVLGGGLSRLHPQDHAHIAREILVDGAVISEFPMTMSPTRHTFPMRNRIISGLSTGVLVIEAGLNSGSLITANYAIDYGKTVFALPGQADSPMARGCNKLIKEGAILTETFDDIIEGLEFLPGFQSKRGNKPEKLETPAINNLSEIEQKIIDELSIEDISVDTLSNSTQLAIGELLSTLMQLEIKKIIQKQNNGKYHLCSKK